MDNDNKTIVLTDDEGKEYEFVLLGFTEYTEKLYAVFMPAEETLSDDEESEVGLIVMEAIDDGDETSFELVEDEEIGNDVLDKFMNEQEEEEEQ